jgi:hypothetical protein
MRFEELRSDDHLLTFMEYRASTAINLLHKSDVDFIRRAMRQGYLKKETPGNRMYRFTTEDEWGTLFVPNPEASPDTEYLLRGSGGYEVVPEDVGTLVMKRAGIIMSFLAIMVDLIMEFKQQACGLSEEAMIEDLKIALRKRVLIDWGRSAVTTFQFLRAVASEQYILAADHKHFLCKEPRYLSEVAKRYFYSNAGSIADEQGKLDTATMESFACTRIVLQAFIDAYEAQGNWKAILLLVAAIGDNTTKDSAISQEIWCMCLKELQRSCRLFKRFLQTDKKSGKFFVRGRRGVHLKFPLDVIDKKHQYMALLISVATNKPELEHLQEMVLKIMQFEIQAPKHRESIADHVSMALADVTVITIFMTRLQSVMEIPEDCTFIFQKGVNERMSALKVAWFGIDMKDYAYPV